MKKQRKDYIADLLRYGVEAEILVPTIVIDGKTIDSDNFKIFKESLEILQEDEQLIIEITELEDDLTSINISLKPTNSESSDEQL